MKLQLTSGLLAAWAACTEPNPRYQTAQPVSRADGPTAADTGGDAATAPAPDRDPLAPADGSELPDAAAAEAGVDAAADFAVDALAIEDSPVDATPEVPAAEVSLPVNLSPLTDAPPPVNLVTGLFGYWRFDEPDGARTIGDSSGRGHTGAFEGSSSGTAFIDGKFGRALELTTPDRDFGIRVAPLTPEIRNLSRYTLAAWVYRRRNTPAEFCGIISRQIAGQDSEVFSMMVSRDYLKAYGPDRNSASGSVTTASTPTPTPLGVWFHAAATYDGTRIRIYQDGVERGSDTWSNGLPSTESLLYLATKKVVNYAHPFIGALDEILLYDHPLPANAIMALALGERPPLP